jgi:hypothetical protein
LKAEIAATMPIGSLMVQARRPSLEAHWDLDPSAGSQKVRRRANAVDRTIGLDQCIRQRLSALPCDQDAEILPLLGNQVGELVEDGDPLMRLQPGLSVREQLSCSLEFRLQRGGVVTGEFGDLFSVECLYDFDHHFLHAVFLFLAWRSLHRRSRRKRSSSRKCAPSPTGHKLAP